MSAMLIQKCGRHCHWWGAIMVANRLRLMMQNVLIFGGLFISIATMELVVTKLFFVPLVALLVATLGSLSVVYKKQQKYTMVFTEEATDEDIKEETYSDEPRINYFKGTVNYFLYGLCAVVATSSLINFDFSTKYTVIFIVSVFGLIFTRYNFEKHSPLMIFEDVTIQFILFTGLGLLVKSTQDGMTSLLSAVMFAMGVLMFTSMLVYRYHTVTYYKHKKTSKLPKNSTVLVLIYGLSLSFFLASIGVAWVTPLFYVLVGVFVVVLFAVLVLFRSDNTPSVKDIL